MNIETNIEMEENKECEVTGGLHQVLMEEFRNYIVACKSKGVYDKWFEKYMEFKAKNNCEDDCEGVLLGFLLRSLSTSRTARIYL
jgi:hypothetical protein